LPIIVLLRRGPDTKAARDALQLPGDVTLVERPVRVNTLVAVVRSALRSRRRQYLLRDDINERKRVEEEIKRLNADLATRADELEEANRELETFNYSVAHDLRTPLTVISGYLGILNELCGNELKGECREYIRNAYEGALKMNQLIDALLEFSRLGRVEPSRETVDLGAIAQEILQELQRAEAGAPGNDTDRRRRDRRRRPEPAPSGSGEPSRQRLEVHSPARGGGDRVRCDQD
jgi:signal transduction histidine kinase